MAFVLAVAGSNSTVRPSYLAAASADGVPATHEDLEAAVVAELEAAGSLTARLRALCA